MSKQQLFTREEVARMLNNLEELVRERTDVSFDLFSETVIIGGGGFIMDSLIDCFDE